MADDAAARWKEIEEAFFRVVGRQGAERLTALRRSCRRDQDLRQQVERLLKADAEVPENFLQGSQDRIVPALGRRGTVEPGARLGSYRVERFLAEGGMSVVLLARHVDAPYDRLVALKVPAWSWWKPAQARFLLEVQILARLEHPFVARLYDAGSSEDGRPFLAMEYVRGDPIDRYCAERNLSLKSRLGLFLRVCEAVRYLHQRLVVHGDLKPANILITSEGLPKLLDFGAAKLLALSDDGLDPRLGPAPRTPRYASPEQVRGGAVHAATDVYSLGVLLYELTTGHSPYEGVPAEALYRAIRERDPPRPSKAVLSSRGSGCGPGGALEIAARRRLSRRLRGDLDAIVLRAMCKAPSARYPSVDQLSQDLRRHRAGLPVAARHATVHYRASRCLRRNRPVIASTVAILGLLLGWLTTGEVQRRHLAGERDKAEKTLEMLVDSLVAFDPYEGATQSTSVPEVLARATERVQRGLPGDAPAQARLLDAIGRVYLRLGRYREAESLLEKALTLRERYGNRSDIAESRQHLGELYCWEARLDAAREYLEAALVLRRETGSAGSLEVAETLAWLGSVERWAERSAESERAASSRVPQGAPRAGSPGPYPPAGSNAANGSSVVAAQ